ncbi:hypothetical protein TTHERM_01043120 (macronuclear) [Tetrahymena thermophila SB210]|uniref:Uncharacterized protein n=1 Tax=Tetrahymena thermophila (strain SB210) TaxID=312017 RepID=Q22CJ7_TETTS|nr:hypothetical protein TTHERM_01043120 [Tetrahymena thermophila SB210]EAR82995.1 hypothetical protein TTHERM_01043120 [Tetrahymena thermophila SB210]|eukprot:XP_001030658.1 hypothetical protein TTHERM_01043120 [Tetrahymena thermophila SB210]
MNRAISTYEQQNSTLNQHQQIQISQQALPQNPQQLQLIQQQQPGPQQQQIYTLSPTKNVRIEQQNSPCRIVNIQPVQHIQQIHPISKKQFYIPTSITPNRQRIVTQQVQSNSINSIQIQNSASNQPQVQQQNQQISFQQQNPSQIQQNTSQNIQASSKPISQMPEKHRLLQQSHKHNLSQNQNSNNNNNTNNSNNHNNLVGNGQISSHLNAQTKAQQGIQPSSANIKTTIQRVKNKSEINLPSDFSQTPIQHIQTPQQMISLNNMFIQNSITSPPTQNISVSQNLFPSNIDYVGTPNNQNNGQVSLFSDNNPSHSASFPHSIQSTSNNFSAPQTAVKQHYLKNQNQQERENSPYKYLQNQLSTNQKSPNLQSTNQKSPNMQSTNIGISTQNSGQIPFVFSEEAAVGSINVGNSSSANRYVNKIQQSSPERLPQFFIKQSYQLNNGSYSNAYTPKGNSSSISNISQIGIPQQTKTSTEFARSSSCNDVRKRSYRNPPLYQDNQFIASNNRTLNISQNDRADDRSLERTQGITHDINTTQKPHSMVSQSGSYINLPRTPTKINQISSSQNFQIGLLNSNSKKLRELEEQVKELVNENSKLSELLEEKGYLLQQIQDEQLVQKLLIENNELKEKLRQAQMENDLSIQNRVLHTENTNLNKILSEKVKEIRELKEKLQQNSQSQESQRKVDQLERNIKLLIQENEHLSDVLKQRQSEVQKQRDDNLEMQNKVINLQSYIQELQEQQSRQQSISNEKFNSLKSEYDKIQNKLAEKEHELQQKEQNAQKINREAEDQITKLVDENEKLNEIISQYINSSNTDLLNSMAINKNTSKLNIVKDDEEKLQMFDSLQNCNKDYEEKIKNLIAQNKNLEEVILDLEKDKIELAENLQFMEDRQKVIEKQNDDLQMEIEKLSKQETACTEIADKVKLLESQNQDLHLQIDQMNQGLTQKSEENQLIVQQNENNKNYFEQIIQEKIEQINRLSQQLQEQSNFIQALQQQQQIQQIHEREEDEQEEEKTKKAANKKQTLPSQRYQRDDQISEDEDQEQIQQQNQENNIKSADSTFNQLNEDNYFDKESEQLIETPLDSNTFELTKFQKELKEKNDIIKNLCENLDFQKEQVSELNEKVQQQAIFIIDLQEKIKKSQNEINQQGEKILELLSNASEDQSISKSQRKSREIASQQNDQELLQQQLEYKDHAIQEYILVIRELDDKIINLQKLLKELKPDLQLDNSFYIERLESLNLLSPNISNNLKERKITQMEERILIQVQQQDNDEDNHQKQQNLINPQKIQSLIDREISQFDQKYKQKMEELEKEMSVSINERDEKIVSLINENQKLLQLNEQRLIELKILNQQIEMRKEQNIRDTKTIEDLQKKIQMMLSKNIQQNKGILKNSQHFQQNTSERSLIDSIREEESEESQDVDSQKNQQQHASQSHEAKRLQRKLEEKRRQLSDAKQELENLKEKLLDFEEIEFRLTSENRQLQEEVRRLSQHSDENNRLNEMLKTRKNEYTELKKRFEALRAERDELIQKLKDSQFQDGSPSNQLNNSKSFNVNSFELYKEIESIKKENHELKKINEQCIVQIKKKEKEIDEKMEELDQVKNKCNELTEQIKTSNSAPQSICTIQGQEDQKEQIQKPRSANNL